MMSEFVQVFGCRHNEAIHALRRPASKKRQGTKSWEVGHRWRNGRLWGFDGGAELDGDAMTFRWKDYRVSGPGRWKTIDGFQIKEASAGKHRGCVADHVMPI
jgi:hypothetical protein